MMNATPDRRDPVVPRFGEVSAQRIEALRAFWAAYPARTLEAAGCAWQYRVVGQGDRVLVLLPDAASSAACDLVAPGYQQILHLAEKRRVIAVTLPPSASAVSHLTDGLIGILGMEGVLRADILGYALGALAGQAFLRRYPNRVRSLIVAGIGAPERWRVLAARVLLGLAGLLPEGASWRLKLAHRGLALTLHASAAPDLSAPGDGGPQACYDAEETITSDAGGEQSTAWRLERLRCVLDALRPDGAARRRYSASALRRWPGRLLILEPGGSRFSDREREALRKQYPQTHVQVVAVGHAGPGGSVPAYQLIDSFLQEVDVML